MTTASLTVLSNKKNKSITLYFTTANNVLATGNSITSNVGGTSTCVAVGTEIINSLNIKKVVWGTANSNCNWTVNRNANTVLVLSGTGEINFEALGTSLSVDATGSVNTAISAGSGFLILELQKNVTFTGSVY